MMIRRATNAAGTRWEAYVVQAVAVHARVLIN